MSEAEEKVMEPNNYNDSEEKFMRRRKAGYDYRNNYVKVKYDRIPVIFPKDTILPRIRAVCAETHESTNSFVRRAIDEFLPKEEERLGIQVESTSDEASANEA